MNAPSHQASLVVFLGVLLLIALSNLLVLRRLGRYGPPAHFPRVSVLLLARNEESNIRPCVQSLLAQDYPDFEVLVLNDASSDRTEQFLAEMAAGDDRLRVLRGEPLPPDWLGKHWACHQLAQAASGELFLFTDADTRHGPQALRDAVAALQAEKADLLVVLPQEEAVTWSENLIIPLLFWVFLSFVPLVLATRLRASFLSAAIGQYMLFRRPAYEQCGGHAAIRKHVADDVALGRRIKRCGFRWFLVDGSRQVRCRMYQNFRQVFEGFSKNLFAAFDYRLPLFVFVWTWLLLVAWEPPVVLVLGLAGVPLGAFSPWLAGAAFLEFTVLWGLACARFRYPLYLALLHPLSILLMSVIAARSLYLALTGRATWSGRVLVQQRVRWW